MNSVLTIVTKSHLNYALSLRESIIEYNTDIDFFFFIADGDLCEKQKIESEFDRTFVLLPVLIESDEYSERARLKYVGDVYRWTMKPIIMALILRKGYKSCLYFDCDIYVYDSLVFLYDLLEESVLLLTPHYRSMTPFIDEVNFTKNFSEGIFNAGFVGVSNNGIGILNWWAEACLFRCEKNVNLGLHDDQKYLDLLPGRFDNVHVIRHLGCNVAEWNKIECRREMIDGKVLINGKYPIIFMHFTGGWWQEILDGTDGLLLSYYLRYKQTLEKYRPFSIVDSQDTAYVNKSKKRFTLKSLFWK